MRRLRSRLPGRLAADEHDREEMQIIRAQLADSLRRSRTEWSAARSSACRCREVRGHEQRSDRFAVIVQADEFLELSTVLVSPTSTSARPASFPPTITLDGAQTRVLVEQTTVVDPQRLGRSAGRLDANEPRTVDGALMLVLGL